MNFPTKLLFVNSLEKNSKNPNMTGNKNRYKFLRTNKATIERIINNRQIKSLKLIKMLFFEYFIDSLQNTTPIIKLYIQSKNAK